jgi:hypothetical protein
VPLELHCLDGRRQHPSRRACWFGVKVSCQVRRDELLAPETASTIVNGRSFAGLVVTAALNASAARLRAERTESVGIEIEKSKSSLGR